MKYLTALLLLLTTMNTEVIFDFESDANLQNWNIVDDVVMGGRSNGNFSLQEEGHGLFEGSVSLENNGGFSSLRYRMPEVKVRPSDTIKIRLKGDGSRYQFRVKQSRRDYVSYIGYFETSGDWEEIRIPLNELYPNYRGNRLNQPDFDHDTLQEIGFLIGNNKPQDFRLLIDEITLVKDG